MKKLTNLALIATLLLASPAFANPMVHAHQHDAATSEQAETYHCPMHPEVTGEKGDSCPKCGMFLTPVTATENTHAPVHTHQHH